MVGRRKTNYGLPPRMYQYRGKKTVTYYTITPSNERINLGHDLIEAKKRLIELEDGRPVAGTIGDLIDRYMKEVAPKKAPQTYKGNIAEAEKLLSVFGKMKPQDLRPMHVAKYLDLRGKVAPVRANREKALLSHIFSMAMRWGIVDTNPCRGVARNTETPRDRYVSDIEFSTFLKFASSQGETGEMLALIAEMAYLTGQRRQDILALHRARVSDDGILFIQKKGKGASKVLVEWTDRLAECVERCKALPREINGLYLICNRKGQPYTDSGFKAMWNRLQIAWHESGNERFHFHDIRAKSASDLLEAGRKATDITGHKSEDMLQKVYDRRKVTKGKAVK